MDSAGPNIDGLEEEECEDAVDVFVVRLGDNFDVGPEYISAIGVEVELEKAFARSATEGVGIGDSNTISAPESWGSSFSREISAVIFCRLVSLSNDGNLGESVSSSTRGGDD